MADDDALDDLADEVLFVRYEAAGGFKLKPQLLVGASLGLVEDQLIGTDTECHGRAPALQAETDLATSTVRQQLGYDGLGRLVTATGPYGDYSYTYDGIGNRLSRTDTDGTPDETLSYLQNPHGHNSPLLASVQNGFVHPVTHDLEGNVTDDGIARYTIGPRNHVREQLSLSGPTLRQYTYTADGLLAASQAGTDGPQRIFMRGLEGRLLAELIVPPGSDDPSQSTVYVWFGDRLLMTSDDLEYPAQQFVASNHIGFPITTIGVDRQRWMVLWDGDHEPFGSVVGDTTNAPRLRYPGQWAEHPALEAHTPTSRSHFINGHRWYVPEWGRYSQSDPLGTRMEWTPGRNHLFAYADGNPLGSVDPLGLATLGKGGSVTNLSSCCVLVSQNNPVGSGQKQQWIKPRRMLLGLFVADVDAVYFNDGSALKIPDSDGVVVYNCADLESATNVTIFPPNSMRPGKFKYKYLENRDQQSREFGGPILGPDGECCDDK